MTRSVMKKSLLIVVVVIVFAACAIGGIALLTPAGVMIDSPSDKNVVLGFLLIIGDIVGFCLSAYCAKQLISRLLEK
jgi:preprotein translocase subunit SecE